MTSFAKFFFSGCVIAFFLATPLYADNTVPPDTKHTTGTMKDNEKKQPAAPGRDAPIWDKNKNLNTLVSPHIKKIKDGVLQVGNILVNKKEGSVLINGQVNMQEGLVEYLACGSFGKLHESVLRLYSEPFHIQIALLLLGLEPGKRKLKKQGALGIPSGDPIEIWVSWFSDDKKTITHRAEDLLFNKQSGRAMKETQWIFTGSQVIKGRFMAQVEHSIAATYHDPYAIIDHPLKTGIDDTLYYANKMVLPPKGTTIKFLIKSKKTEE